jgi:uncharacterized membrane protein YeaQ/YmgE (transglycosylase-associated protein family)
LWIVCGGIVAAYVLQQNQATSITPGDGAIAGLLAGVVGAFVYLVLSIPITLLVAPLERAMMERIIDSGTLPPEFREYVGSYVGGAVQIILSFGFMLVAGAVFSTIGGVLGAMIFKKQLPPGTIDIPTQSG